LQDVFERIGGIEEFQIHNISSSVVRVNLVVPHKPARCAITQKLQRWWGNNVEVHFVAMDELKKVGWQEKFRYLV